MNFKDLRNYFSVCRNSVDVFMDINKSFNCSIAVFS